MAIRIPYTPKNIIINIPDVVKNNTILKRKAKLFTMTYNQNAGYVALNWIVSFYSIVSGETGDAAYGESLSSFIPDYSYESVASNLTCVNPDTGEIIFPVTITGTTIVTPEVVIPAHEVIIVPAVLDENGVEITPAVTETVPEVITPAVTETTSVVDYAIDYMGQYDWFNMIAEAMPIQVHRMIEQYGANVSVWDKS